MPYITDNEGTQWEYRETSKFGGMNEVNRLAQDGWMFCRTRSLPERLCDGSYYNHTIYILKRPVEKTESTPVEEMGKWADEQVLRPNALIEMAKKTEPTLDKNKCDCCGWDDMGYIHEPQCQSLKPVEKTEATEPTPKKCKHYHKPIVNCLFCKDYVNRTTEPTPDPREENIKKIFSHKTETPYVDRAIKDSLIEQLEKIQGYTSKYPNNLSLADHRAYIEGVIKPIDQIIKRLKND